MDVIESIPQDVFDECFSLQNAFPPPHYFHLDKDLIVTVDNVNDKVRVKINQKSNLPFIIEKEIILSPFLWQSLCDYLKTCVRVDLPTIYEEYYMINNKLFVSSIENKYISLQRCILNKDLSRQFLQPGIIFNEKQWSNLKHLKNEISDSVKLLKFKLQFPIHVKHQIQRHSPFLYVEETDQLEAEITLITSLCEILTETLKKSISDVLVCDGCLKGYSNQLGHICLEKNDILDEYFDLAVSRINLCDIAETFVYDNIGLIHYITDSFFYNLDVKIMLDTVRLLY